MRSWLGILVMMSCCGCSIAKREVTVAQKSLTIHDSFNTGPEMGQFDHDSQMRKLSRKLSGSIQEEEVSAAPGECWTYSTFFETWYCPGDATVGECCCVYPECAVCPYADWLCVDVKLGCCPKEGFKRICGRYCCQVDECCGDGCCVPGVECCEGTCCGEGQSCCGGESCCDAGKCCGDKCCRAEESCCDGTCCGEGESCCGGETCCDNEVKFCCDGTCVWQDTTIDMGIFGWPQPALPGEILESRFEQLEVMQMIVESESFREGVGNCQTFAQTGVLYRALSSTERVFNPCDNPNRGLMARWTAENKATTIQGHVNCGSRATFKGSWFMSFTTSEEVAATKYNIHVDPPQPLAKVSDLPPGCHVYDFNVPAVADQILGNMLCKRFAMADCEVVVYCDWETEPFIPCSYYDPGYDYHEFMWSPDYDN